MTFGLVDVSYSLPKGQAAKLAFSAPCTAKKSTYPHLTSGRGWVILENEKSANKPQTSNNLVETLYYDAGWDGTIRSEWGRIIAPVASNVPLVSTTFRTIMLKPETKSLHLCALSRGFTV